MSLYTDMAKEAYYSLKNDVSDGIISNEHSDAQSINVHEVVISTESAAKQIGKACGRYVTIESDDIEESDMTDIRMLSECLSREIKRFLPNKRKVSCLVLGLGNRAVTPDSLGPKACDKILITRHIKEHVPQMLDRDCACVSALAAGVLATTGIETCEIARSIVERIRPDVVIVIDALAAGSISRIGRSIQITDAGISPGSGIGNKRHALDDKSLGVPVIAVGVPTVVYAKTIAEDLLSCAVDVFSRDKNDNDIEKIINILQEIEGGELIVAPKNIDGLTDDAAFVIAEAINSALNPGVDIKDMQEYLR